MIEVISLTLINLFIIAFLLIMDKNNRKERKELINRLIAKNIQEVITLDEKDKPIINIEKENNEYVSAESLDEIAFDKMIKQQLINKNK